MRHRDRPWIRPLICTGSLLGALLAPSPTDGAEVRQLTYTPSTRVTAPVAEFKLPALDASGTTLYINASADPSGANPDNAYQIMRFNTLTGAGTQVTAFPEAVTERGFGVSVSDDGQWLAFISRSDPTGQNHDESLEVFVMHPDGSALEQVTSDPASNAGSVSMIALSGSANRIAFVSNSDLTGANPAYLPQLFVIDRDGTNLQQLTGSAGGEFRWISISDDGTRAAFCHSGNLTGGNPEGNFEVHGVNADGTNLRQFTSSSAGDTYVAAIGGNGRLVVFDSTADYVGSNPDGGYEVFKVEWTGGTITQVTNSVGAWSEALLPSITDDTERIVFTSNTTADGNSDGGHEFYVINADGSGLARITSHYYDPGPVAAVVSGDGSRIGYVPFTNQLGVMSSSGTEGFVLIDAEPGNSYWPDIASDGSRIVFVSTYDFHDGTWDLTDRIFALDAGSSDPVRLTDFGSFEDSIDPSVSGDGSLIAFASYGNPTGQNPGHRLEIFRMSGDGGGVQQLTFSPPDEPSAFSRIPAVSEDGSRITFSSNADLLDLYLQPYTASVYCVNTDGSGLALVTPDLLGYGFSAYSRLDFSGTWVVFHSTDDHVTGSNTDGSTEIFRAHCDGTAMEQISSSPDPGYYSIYPDIDRNGEYVVWQSTADPLGTNADHNPEIFLYETAEGLTRQLTVTTDAENSGPRISRDGSWVYFVSDAQLFEFDPDRRFDLLRVHVDTGVIERAAGMPLGNVDVRDNNTNGVAVSGDGSRAAFAGYGNFTESNADLSREVWMADYGVLEPVDVDRASGRLSWAPVPRAVRYDAIRGSVSNIEDDGATIDLGPVLCLEDDSPDPHTAGFEDPELPPSGEVFFYVFRGSEGIDVGPGDYGTGTGGVERTAGGGDCAP